MAVIGWFACKSLSDWVRYLVIVTCTGKSGIYRRQPVSLRGSNPDYSGCRASRVNNLKSNLKFKLKELSNAARIIWPAHLTALQCKAKVKAVLQNWTASVFNGLHVVNDTLLTLGICNDTLALIPQTKRKTEREDRKRERTDVCVWGGGGEGCARMHVCTHFVCVLDFFLLFFKCIIVWKT